MEFSSSDSEDKAEERDKRRPFLKRVNDFFQHLIIDSRLFNSFPRVTSENFVRIFYENKLQIQIH